MKPVLLDTGAIVALLDRSEKFHQACAAAIRELEAPLITCEAVLAESYYLLRNLPGASEAVIENVAAVRKYRDRKIDLADACLICLAEEFGTADILTLDKDFEVYRWSRRKPFRILLALS